MLRNSKRSVLIVFSLVLAALTPAYAAKKPAPKQQPKETAQAKLDQLSIAYLAQEPQSQPTLPFFDEVITDRGIQGARLGIRDNNTTGRFTGQNFTLRENIVPPDGDVTAAFKSVLADGYRHILVNLDAAKILELAALPESQNVLLYDIASRDDQLRGESCRPNVLHLLPSRAMRADALAQYFAKKRWNKWFLAVGPSEGDKLYADAIKRAAKRFGSKIVAEKTWQHTFDERRTPESEVPVFTQGIQYDVLVVADESGLFGDYLPYRTWQPRPVAGTQGLVAAAWHQTHEAWGALQLQNRFRDQAGRWMTEEDYGAWLAVRAIGESATRTKSVDFDKVKTFMLGEEFALAGFKGVPLSFRRWNGQLRQPVLLAWSRSLVAVAPVEGFIHPRNELDTLGYDEPESKCRF
ncbi:ABC transporter substrate-binding protein [Methylocaldum szegediense]|uniref:ABC transporter substrate binding protein (PQQ-dependent alcohol dehydrogenase system) n=1 Tax=Methylocaldum szegediense TaxID=73780 RepID=A0ABN8X7D1_9GAMM|nr:ABC transporter substrate-binding protein [Methylocaldum szegediense]CAI8922976.1 ABC transporter substrate binding protein (PQQ-dependent alcohol dehydrogenase system) [Methylocaldum szegediense]